MSDRPRRDDLQALWQSQPRTDAALSLEEIHTAQRRLEERIGRRNRREYIAAAIVVIAYGAIVWVGPSAALRAGGGLVIAATLWVVHKLRVHGGASPLPADLAVTTAVEFHRAELERQRDLLRSVWLWALLPFAPGMAAFAIGLARQRPERTLHVVAFAVASAVLMAALHVLNRRAAARIQRRLDRLEADH